MGLMSEMGITPVLLQQHHIGPVLFREECLFKREIRFGDLLKVHINIAQLSRDFRKWSMYHELWINEATLAATLMVDGAWMDTEARKITAPPPLFAEAFDRIPKTGTFAWHEANGQ